MMALKDLLPANSGWTLDSAIDINDAGQIVGYGEYQARRRAFLLTPEATVPEPGSGAMCCLLLVAFALLRRVV